MLFQADKVAGFFCAKTFDIGPARLMEAVPNRSQLIKASPGQLVFLAAQAGQGMFCQKAVGRAVFFVFIMTSWSVFHECADDFVSGKWLLF